MISVPSLRAVTQRDGGGGDSAFRWIRRVEPHQLGISVWVRRRTIVTSDELAESLAKAEGVRCFL